MRCAVALAAPLAPRVDLLGYLMTTTGSDWPSARPSARDESLPDVGMKKRRRVSWNLSSTVLKSASLSSSGASSSRDGGAGVVALAVTLEALGAGVAANSDSLCVELNSENGRGRLPGPEAGAEAEPPPSADGGPKPGAEVSLPK